MVDDPTGAAKPPGTGQLICLIGGMMIGAAVAKAIAASALPPKGQGFDITQLVAAGLGGGLGAALGSVVWLLTGGRRG